MSQTEKFYTPISSFEKLLSSNRQTFLQGKTLTEKYRREQLELLYKLINDNAEQLTQAIQKDIKNRPSGEIAITEISAAKNEIAHLLNNLPEYMTPKKVPSTVAFMTDSAQLHYTPRGNVLIISAWNFPIQLLIIPLAGAISAGCTAIIKPSEVAHNVSLLVAELIPKYLDPEAYKVILGGAKETTELLKYKFDLIFYTGNPNVGKIINEAAAKHLTPCVLELGGKNPVVVDDTCDINIAARRIAWGRWVLNCGQVCLSPEYVIINKNKEKEFVQALIQAIEFYFGKDVKKSSSYARTINSRHFQRVSKILSDNKQYIIYGGETDATDNYVSPTILSNVDDNAPIMKEEVFGPLLTIYPVNDVQKQAVPIIQNYEKPLALYIFSNDKLFVEKIVSNTDSGGVTVNDVITHFTFPGFPFGGTGQSGMGKYHGWYSFLAYSHEKPVLFKYSGLEKLNDVRNPPFDNWKIRLWSALLEEKPKNALSKLFSMTPVVAMVLGGTAYYLQSKL